MTDAVPDFAEHYASALEDYVAATPEAGLEQAYERGREAIAAGLGVLDIAAAHQELLLRLLRGARTPEEIKETAQRASEFLAESLSPFEMTHRGFQETIAKLVSTNQALRKSEANNRALLDAIPDWIFRISTDGSMLDFHAGIEGSVRGTRDQLVGRHLSEVLPAEVVQQVMKNAERALRSGTIEVFEYQLPLDGHPHEYEARLVVSGKDEVLGIVRDITEERHWERVRLGLARVAQRIAAALDIDQALATAVNELVASFDVALARVWLWDETEQILVLRASTGLSNRTATTGSRYGRIRLGQLKIGAIAANRQRFWSNRLLEESWLLEPAWARRKGIVAFAGFPLLVADEVVGVLGLFSRRAFDDDDLTALGTVADQLAVAIDHTRLLTRLQVVLRLREEFIAAAAHELRTPVTVLKGYVSVLRKRAEIPPAVLTKALEGIEYGADRVTRLAWELAETAELESGTLSLGLERFDLAEHVRRVVAEVQAGCPGYDLRLQTTPAEVIADGKRIGEVIRHLLENAVKYQPAGGAIEVMAGVEAGEAVVSVRDHGHGIPPERQAHIFEPMYEPIPSGAPDYVGIVGLGLGISKRLIELHGGRIWFDSETGRGSTFYFALPLAR